MISSKTLVAGLILLLAYTVSSCDLISGKSGSNYGESTLKSYEGARNTGDFANVQLIQNAINGYYAANNAYPPTIQEVAKLVGSPVDPDKFEYDPGTGIVKLRSSK